MEISEIQTAKPVSHTNKKEGVSHVKVDDRLSISSESEKKGMWVEMLKEMPDVRPEKIEAACKTFPSSRELAEAMLNAT